MKKQLLSIILALGMLLGTVICPADAWGVYEVQAADSSEEDVNPLTGEGYRHAPHLLNSAVITCGVRVSEWQRKIDWELVKAQGAQFAFIRCGNTIYSDKFVTQEDPYFRQNIQNAYNAGIKIGVYYSSNAVMVSEAEQEAQRVLEWLSDYKEMITLPVIYDGEILGTSSRANELTAEQRTLHALTFFKILQNAGYPVMYSGSPAYLDKAYDMAQMQGYECMVLDEAQQTSYFGEYTYWKYASTGRIDGLEGAAGCIFHYEKPAEEPEKLKNQIITYKTNKIKNGKAEYGAKFLLNAKSSGTGKLSYKSSNKKVLTVDSKGKVTIKGYGRATITIKAAAAPGYRAASKNIKITVTAKK